MFDEDDTRTLDITDPDTGGSRLLSRKCPTCIFRPNNGIYLPESTARLARQACADDSYIVCHSTYLDGQPPPHAICRGFFDEHAGDSLALRLLVFLGRLVEVAPPRKCVQNH
jgi:hypothetical protein